MNIFESIPGQDSTEKATTDNRGNYGARVGMRFKVDKVPPDCQEMALLVYNNGDVYGGRHWVTDGKKQAFEISCSTSSGGLLKKGTVCTLWRGPLQAGDELTMWSEPIANTSVHLWYVLVALPSVERQK